jgi:hypothetical protein
MEIQFQLLDQRFLPGRNKRLGMARPAKADVGAGAERNELAERTPNHRLGTRMRQLQNHPKYHRRRN